MPFSSSSTQSIDSNKNVSLRVSAPGKVILHGEHSVVYDKLALAASVGLRTTLVLSETDLDANKPPTVRLDLPCLQLEHCYLLKDLQIFLSEPLPLSKAPAHFNLTQPDVINHDALVDDVRRFLNDKGGSMAPNEQQFRALTSFFYLFKAILGGVELTAWKPFKISVTTELTLNAGTGSSASFAVVLAAALLQFVKVKGGKAKVGYRTLSLGKPDDVETELISKWAYSVERITHGTPSGVDNTVCTHGSWVEFRRGSPPKLLHLIAKFKVILIDTHVPRDTKVLVSKVAALRQRQPCVIDAILKTMDKISQEALKHLKKLDDLDDFEVADHYQQLADLCDINQNMLRSLGVSHPKIDEVCALLGECGLKGKLTGAGGGGYVLCLVPPHIERGIVEKAVGDLNRRGFSAVVTELGGDGVRIH